MKIVDNMPIFVVIAAIFVNIAVGVSSGISFSALMIRCMVITVVFGVFGYLVTETVKNAVECSSLSKLTKERARVLEGQEDKKSIDRKKSVLDIKVPPLEDEELMIMDSDSDEGFVEVNPVHMGNYIRDEQV